MDKTNKKGVIVSLRISSDEYLKWHKQIKKIQKQEKREINFSSLVRETMNRSLQKTGA